MIESGGFTLTPNGSITPEHVAIANRHTDPKVSNAEYARVLMSIANQSTVSVHKDESNFVGKGARNIVSLGLIFRLGHY